MPNIMGGRQDHPAYMRRKLKSNEVLIGGILYTITVRGKNKGVEEESLSGNTDTHDLGDKYLPRKIKNRISELQGRK